MTLSRLDYTPSSMSRQSTGSITAQCLSCSTPSMMRHAAARIAVIPQVSLPWSRGRRRRRLLSGALSVYAPSYCPPNRGPHSRATYLSRCHASSLIDLPNRLCTRLLQRRSMPRGACVSHGHPICYLYGRYRRVLVTMSISQIYMQ